MAFAVAWSMVMVLPLMVMETCPFTTLAPVGRSRASTGVTGQKNMIAAIRAEMALSGAESRKFRFLNWLVFLMVVVPLSLDFN